jgi:hypothetical protein
MLAGSLTSRILSAARLPFDPFAFWPAKSCYWISSIDRANSFCLPGCNLFGVQ